MKNKNKQTKFPVARIKKIMQKDEEVGKVAQATPVVISKALELFLGLIIDEASKVTVDRGAKKVEAYHLKHAVDTTEMLDFLKEIVAAVPDPSAGGTIDLVGDNGEAKKKSRGKAAAKRAAGGDGTMPKKRARKKAGGGDVKMEAADEEPEEEQEEEDEDEPEDDSWNAPGPSSRAAKAEDDDSDSPYLPKKSR